MTFISATRTGLSKWITFKGRASRSEFWWFTLAYLLMMAVIVAISLGIIILADIDLVDITGTRTGIAVLIISAIPLIFLWIASISVTVRRLHDLNLSGWLLFGYMFITNGLDNISERYPETDATHWILFGASIVISIGGAILMMRRGSPGPNEYGNATDAEDPAEIFI